ncbi:DNA-binding domain-containing protein [Agarilytica rhodophyticola]|uniref:HvfC/BufC N-terminal domain-containing protein n=1 Tax=Agarilytica rhodophyticola TaxID=1737490 RepID=UPI000B3489C4|nr:DNA-binding domain-containing protein [Agarilytica rhodophyticola]
MNKIAEQQQIFVENLIDRSFLCAEDFVSSESCSFTERFGLYVHNSYQTWRNAVASCYPITKKVLGDDGFTNLIAAFVDECPPTSHDLNYYGAGLANFLSHYSADNSEPILEIHPYLRQLCEIEWCIYIRYYYEDDKLMNTEQWQAFASCKSSNIKFSLSKSMGIFNPNWNFSCLFHSIHSEPQHSLRKSSEYIAVFRNKFKVELAQISKLEYSILQAIFDGMNLDYLIEKFGESGAALLPVFINKHWITGYLFCHE